MKGKLFLGNPHRVQCGREELTHERKNQKGSKERNMESHIGRGGGLLNRKDGRTAVLGKVVLNIFNVRSEGAG